jgi:hypothetical protein
MHGIINLHDKAYKRKTKNVLNKNALRLFEAFGMGMCYQIAYTWRNVTVLFCPFNKKLFCLALVLYYT